ncbi:P-loop containing nucleoside triphosphate hydrolase protein [Mycena alexandri]|uniref:P-loop containing nucleoside triphosphate hydrolase protein n=1 Tax=Mycena alexandri TaxID=1745969 RepID=A0AAD6X8U9_9AGAR|nr:P-loop containing nucleoside triphosphate hydrolase protein [Mycena alexandri]
MSKKTRVILVGIGGATCSGKTTLAKHLHRILPNSVIIHQDDFAPPQELVPMHPVHNVQDWDAAPGAIDWPRLVDFLRKVKASGEIPADHRSHDHLNEQKDLPIPPAVRDRWVGVFENLRTQSTTTGDEEIVWGLVDGFLLYWHPEVIAQLDVRIYLRVPHDVLRARRHERHGYHTAVQSDPEGTLWRDPPNYWEQIVYPAYVDANRDVFEDGDVEKGAPTGKVAGLVLLESLEMSMGDAVDRSCEVVAGFLDA